MSSTLQTSAIAKCCYNAALMLEVADSGEREQDKLQRVRKANHGQAALLRQAASIADELTQALDNLLNGGAPVLRQDSEAYRACGPSQEAVRQGLAALAKARGAQS